MASKISCEESHAREVQLMWDTVTFDPQSVSRKHFKHCVVSYNLPFCNVWYSENDIPCSCNLVIRRYLFQMCHKGHVDLVKIL